MRRPRLGPVGARAAGGGGLVDNAVAGVRPGGGRWVPPALESGVDASIKPGDDFFAFANGAWLRAAEIPAGKERWSVRAEIDATTVNRS